MAQTPRRCTVDVDSATHCCGSVFLNSKKLFTRNLIENLNLKKESFLKIFLNIFDHLIDHLIDHTATPWPLVEKPTVVGTTRVPYLTSKKIWSRSDAKRLSNCVHRRTDRQTDRQTDGISRSIAPPPFVGCAKNDST
jgi:hypothetical protein